MSASLSIPDVRWPVVPSDALPPTVGLIISLSVRRTGDCLNLLNASALSQVAGFASLGDHGVSQRQSERRLSFWELLRVVANERCQYPDERLSAIALHLTVGLL
jgi:hypothetical protein